MLQCCEDASESVQAAAVSLVSAMNAVGHLEVEDVDRTIELVFSGDAAVSHAAAELFVKVRHSSPSLHSVSFQLCVCFTQRFGGQVLLIISRRVILFWRSGGD
jgi:hypothetical protein